MQSRTARGPAAAIAALLIAVSLIGLACAKSTSPTEQGGGGGGETIPNNEMEAEETPVDGGTLIMAVTAETNGWNPGSNQWADAGNFVGSSVIEPLMSYDRDGGTVPWLAESVTPKTPGDFTTWVIKLKQGIKFHDGATMDAAAVKRSLDFYKSPASLAAVALGSYFSEDSYRVIDGSTLEAHLTVPWVNYPGNLAGPSGYIMAPSMLDMEDRGSTHPVGTGPYVFQEWKPNVYFKATKNPSYWRPGEPHLTALEFRPIVDSQQRAAALEDGTVDMIFTTRAEDAVAFKGSFTVVTDYNGEKTLVMLNTAQDPAKPANPFVNVHARKALAYATDRKQILEQVSGGLPLQSSTTFALAGTKWEINEGDTAYYSYDPEQAKAEVAKYKEETGATDFSFVLSGLANVDDTQTTQLLQQQWKQVGINADIQTADQTAYITQLALGGFQAAFYRNYAYPDPDSDSVFLTSATAKGVGQLSINFHQLKDDRIDAAFKVGRETDDVATRKAAYVDATKALNDQAVNIWLYNTPYSIIAKPTVKGLNQARVQGFGNFLPKPWFWPNLWKEQ